MSKKMLLISVAATAFAGMAFAQGSADYPPESDAGTCYARVLTPETTNVVTEQVVDRPEGTEIKLIPATYETVTEQILVKEESKDVRVIPATFETVTRTRLVSPERTETNVVPATYKTVTRQVVSQPAQVIEEIIPSVYETISVQKLVTAASEETMVIPATYKTLEKRVVSGGGSLEWREVLCDTNATPGKILAVQTALTDAGYTAPVDGEFGPATLNAMEAYQRANNLPVGYLTVSTVESLGLTKN